MKMVLVAYDMAPTMAQSVRTFASHAEGCVFESQLQLTLVVKESSDSPVLKVRQ